MVRYSLGERQRAANEIADGALLTPVEVVDAVVLAVANERGWTAAQLFEWCNSRNGRHFADMAFTTSRPAEIRAAADRWKIWSLRRG